MHFTGLELSHSKQWICQALKLLKLLTVSAREDASGQIFILMVIFSSNKMFIFYGFLNSHLNSRVAYNVNCVDYNVSCDETTWKFLIFSVLSMYIYHFFQFLKKRKNKTKSKHLLNNTLWNVDFKICASVVTWNNNQISFDGFIGVQFITEATHIQQECPKVGCCSHQLRTSQQLYI